MLALRNAQVDRSELPILKGVSLDVPAGRVVSWIWMVSLGVVTCRTVADVNQLVVDEPLIEFHCAAIATAEIDSTATAATSERVNRFRTNYLPYFLHSKCLERA